MPVRDAVEEPPEPGSAPAIGFHQIAVLLLHRSGAVHCADDLASRDRVERLSQIVAEGSAIAETRSFGLHGLADVAHRLSVAVGSDDVPVDDSQPPDYSDSQQDDRDTDDHAVEKPELSCLVHADLPLAVERFCKSRLLYTIVWYITIYRFFQ
jgi:hypothetical protein